jgi:hypothetical protein
MLDISFKIFACLLMMATSDMYGTLQYLKAGIVQSL